MPATVPVMRMGLIGFADEQYLCNLLMTRTQTLRWERWPFVDADALWVNGTHATPLRDSMVRVPSVDPSKPATILNLKEIDRPTAFSLPLGNAGVKPPRVFDPRSTESVVQVLQAFEQDLQQLGTQLALGREIAERRYEMRSPVYHLTQGGTLVGVLKLAGEIGLAPDLCAADVQKLAWSGRPEAAGAIPPQFAKTSMAHVMWQYLARVDQDLLPTRYREPPIYYRRMPRVSPRMIKDMHLRLISELKSMPQTIDQLRASTGMTEREVLQGLSSLYFAGVITTDPRKAAPDAPWTTRSVEGPSSDLNSSLPDDLDDSPIPPRPGRPQYGGGPELSTVPTPLEPKR